MENKEAFLQDMQKQCLADGNEHINVMHEALLQLEKNTPAALAQLMNASHNLKGNFQAVGFPHCSAFIHRFETVLDKIAKDSKSAQLSGDDARALEFFLSDVIGQLQSYFGELSEQADCEAFGKKRDFVFTIFDTWKTTPAAPVIEAPAAVAPAAVTDAAALIPFDAPAPPASPAAAVAVTTAPAAPAPLVAAPEVPSAEPVLAAPEPGLAIFLVCRNGAFNFALRVERVVEIVRYPEVNPLPYTQTALLGLMNLRGDVIPVLNLRELDQGERAKQLAVICRTEAGKFGVPVESADCVMEIDCRKFQKADKSLGEQGSALVTNVYMEGEQPIFVIEVEKALAAA